MTTPQSPDSPKLPEPMTEERWKLLTEGFAFDSDRDCEAARDLINEIRRLRSDPVRQGLRELAYRLTMYNAGCEQLGSLDDPIPTIELAVDYLKAERDKAEAERDSLREALRPFAEFGQYINDHQRKGLHDELYSWDGSEVAVIRQRDLMGALAALSAPEPEQPQTEHSICPDCGGPMKRGGAICAECIRDEEDYVQMPGGFQ